MSHIWWSGCEQTIAFQIEEDALEQMHQVEQSIAAPLEHLEFVVQAFDEAAIVSVDEIVEDFLPPAAQGVEEMIEAAQSAPGDAFDPGSNFGFGSSWGEGLVENSGQLLLQVICLLQFGRVAKKQSEEASFFGSQVSYGEIL